MISLTHDCFLWALVFLSTFAGHGRSVSLSLSLILCLSLSVSQCLSVCLSLIISPNCLFFFIINSSLLSCLMAPHFEDLNVYLYMSVRPICFSDVYSCGRKSLDAPLNRRREGAPSAYVTFIKAVSCDAFSSAYIYISVIIDWALKTNFRCSAGQDTALHAFPAAMNFALLAFLVHST